jgi:RHS repeat-associated protein
LPDGAAVDFDETASCQANDSVKTVPGSAATFCAADRVDASFGEFNNYATYKVDEQGGQKVVTYDFFGRVTDEGTLQDPDSISFLYSQLPNENGCPDPSGTYGCTVAIDQLNRYYAIAYSAFGIAIEVQDPYQRAWTFGYNSSVDLASITDPNSHPWQFGYDTSNSQYQLANDMTSLTDPDNNTTHITYTPGGTNGGLAASVTDAVGTHTTTFTGWNVYEQDNGEQYETVETHPDGQTVSYIYSGYVLQQAVTTANNGDANYTETTEYENLGTPAAPVQTVIDPAGHSTTDTTDGVGNVLTEANSYGTTTTEYNSFDEPCWSAPPTVTVPTNPTCTNAPAAGAGATLNYYDGYGNQIETVDPTGVATYSAYDTYGNQCWQTIPGTVVTPPAPPCSTPPAASTRYSSNAGTELLSKSTPDGVGTAYTYDTTTYTYNPYGQVLTEVTPDGNVAGGSPAAYTTTNYYDNAGRLYKVVAPLGRTTTAALDAAGNVDSVTDPMGQVTSAAYDADNRTCWSFQGTAASTCSPAPATATRYVYNADTSDPLTVEDPNSNTTTFTYLNPDYPDSATTVKDPLGNITSNVYDKVGNLCVTGAESTSLYASSDPSCAWPTAKGYTYDTFDQLGNVLSSEDPSGNTTTYTRGGTEAAYPSNVTAVTPPSGGSQRATTYTYDLDGRLHTEVEGNGDAVTTTYTATGQKCWQSPVNAPADTCSTAVPNVAGGTGWAYENSQLPYFMTDITAPSTFRYTAWSYDAQGQELAQNSTTGGEVQYAYDAAGDNTCVAYVVSTTLPCSSPASTTNTVVNYGYDGDGRMSSMADWLGNSFTFGYDTRSNLTSIKYPTSTTWTEGFGPYDAANNLPVLTLSSPTLGTGSAYYLHNTDELYSNQNGVGYTYNAKKQVATGGTHTYGYNPNGELASDASGGTTTSYNYDPDAELTSKSAGGATTTYAYDGNGNRCAAASGTTTPNCSSTIAIGTSLVGYNAYNQICYTTGILTVALSNPSCSSPPLLGAATYSYDGNGLRVSDTATLLGLTTQNFDYDTQTRPGQPLIIQDGTSDYLYGPGNFGAGTAPLEQIPVGGTTPTYLFNAPLGLAEQISSAGAVLGSQTYSSYGVKTTTGTITTPFAFQGGYTDPSGLIYLINRYYDPSTGQFLSVDPDVAQTGQPYAYDLDDPLNNVDPLGLKGRCGSSKGSGHVVNSYSRGRKTYSLNCGNADYGYRHIERRKHFGGDLNGFVLTTFIGKTVSNGRQVEAQYSQAGMPTSSNQNSVVQKTFSGLCYGDLNNGFQTSVAYKVTVDVVLNPRTLSITSAYIVQSYYDTITWGSGGSPQDPPSCS